MFHAAQVAGEPRDTREITISLRCPACRKTAVFSGFGNTHDFKIQRVHEGNFDSIRLGSRSCPDPECRAVIFFVVDDATHKLLVSYPSETLDFDSSGPTGQGAGSIGGGN